AHGANPFDCSSILERVDERASAFVTAVAKSNPALDPQRTVALWSRGRRERLQPAQAGRESKRPAGSANGALRARFVPRQLATRQAVVGVCHRAIVGLSDRLRVLGENAAEIARRRWLPVAPALIQFLVA